MSFSILSKTIYAALFISVIPLQAMELNRKREREEEPLTTPAAKRAALETPALQELRQGLMQMMNSLEKKIGDRLDLLACKIVTLERQLVKSYENSRPAAGLLPPLPRIRPSSEVLVVSESIPSQYTTENLAQQISYMKTIVEIDMKQGASAEELSKYSQACVNVGDIYRIGGSGIPRDLNEARKWFLLAAHDAQIYNPIAKIQARIGLGHIYRIGGNGVPQDFNEARKWYLMAAHATQIGAKTGLGDIYRIGGNGVPQDFNEARKWYLMAAHGAQSHNPIAKTQAQAGLGDIYRIGGFGVPQDFNEARKWYLMAADHQQFYSSPAKAHVQECLRILSLTPSEQAASIQTDLVDKNHVTPDEETGDL